MNRKIGGLQSLRAIAAMFVVLQHVTYYAMTSSGIDWRPFMPINYGGIGVELFFVISGFVMSGCLHQGRAFLLNRVLRIYPGYWIAVAISGVLLASPVFGWQFGWRSISLLPFQLNDTYRVPYWTLVYEMVFYAVVYAAILLGLSSERIAQACVVWLLAIIVGSKYLTIVKIAPGTLILFSDLNVYFALGMLLGLYRDDLEGIKSRHIVIASIALWCTADATGAGETVTSNILIAAAFCGALVLGVRHLRSRVLESIGNASFGVYLLHAPVCVLTVHLLTTWFPAINALEMWCAAMVISLGVSYLFGVAEFRMHALIKKAAKIIRGPSSLSLS